MRARITLFSVLIVCLLAASSVALAGPVPRAVPDNDNLANAAKLKIGKAYTIPMAEATDEGPDESNATSCGNYYNSVWYTFTVDEYMDVAFSTGGSLLVSDDFYSTIDTTLNLYEGPESGVTYADLNYVDCNDDGFGNNYAVLETTVQPGYTYYLQVAAYQDYTFLPESYFRLDSRITYAGLNVANFNFEDELGDDNWKVKNGSDDARVCLPDLPVLYGNCSFVFTGSEGESSKLIQTIPVPNAKLRKGAVIRTENIFSLDDAAEVENAKIVLKLTYKDGTPATKSSTSLNGSSPSLSSYGTVAQLASAKLDSIKLQIVHKSGSGTLAVDNVNVYYESTAMVRGAPAGVLPVPAAP